MFVAVVMPVSQMACATLTLNWAAWRPWRGAARIPSPMVAVPTQRLPSDWLSGCSTWRASNGVTWHDTWEKSECGNVSVGGCLLDVSEYELDNDLPLFFSNEFSQMVASEYLSFFDFTGLSLDRALR